MKKDICSTQPEIIVIAAVAISGLLTLIIGMMIVDKWFNQRYYLHFDRAVDYHTAFNIVRDPSNIIRHAFYPFIRHDIIVKKYYFDREKLKILKKPPKIRPIMYSSHIDSHIYSYYAQILSFNYEALLKYYNLDTSVLAFRKLSKSNIDFAFEAFKKIQDLQNCTVLALDVSGFFDNLDHEILKQSWCNILHTNKLPRDHFNIFKSLTKYSEVDKVKLYKTLGISLNNPQVSNERLCKPKTFRELVRPLIQSNKNNYGIPQGSSISPILSNIYMLNFDKTIYESINKIGGYYFRYCDDILIIVPSGSTIEWKGIRDRIYIEINKSKLKLNKNKEDIHYFVDGITDKDKPLHYLGFIFNGHDIFIRSSSLAKFSKKMRKGVRLAKLTMIKYNKIRRKHKQPRRELYLKKLYKRYSYIGKRNFISYGFRAARIMSSDSIRKQLKPLWKQLQRRIELPLKKHPRRPKKIIKKFARKPSRLFIKNKKTLSQ